MRSDAPLPALVVLGCRVGPRGEVGGALGRRLARAVDAFWQTGASLLVTCGGRRWGGHAEAWVMRAHLIAAGVPAHQIVAELWSHNTRENALYAARLLAVRGVERVGLVTCDWHMGRAARLFEKSGLTPWPIPAPSPPAAPAWRAYRAARERVAGWVDASL